MRGQWTSKVPADTDLKPDELTAILEAWKNDFTSWMSVRTARQYAQLVKTGDNEPAKKLLKKTFTACVFQVAGIKDLLYWMIQYPSTSHPAGVLWWLYKQSVKSSLHAY